MTTCWSQQGQRLHLDRRPRERHGERQLRHDRRRHRRPARLRADLNVDETGAEAIPFDGGAPALAALLGGQVDIACLQVGEAMENIEAGKIVPLTVFGPERVEFLPDVPTARSRASTSRSRSTAS